jgi:hypothetical protein
MSDTQTETEARRRVAQDLPQRTRAPRDPAFTIPVCLTVHVRPEWRRNAREPGCPDWTCEHPGRVELDLDLLRDEMVATLWTHDAGTRPADIAAAREELEGRLVVRYEEDGNTLIFSLEGRG